MDLEKIAVESISKKGRGLDAEGRCEVIGALPGEEVLALLGPKKRKVRVAFLREVLKGSAERVEMRCKHGGVCGGCAFQHWKGDSQLKFKQQCVEKWFEGLGEVRPIVGCEDQWRYRNKMEFSFSQDREGEKFLGLIMAGSRGRVINLEECWLVSNWFVDVLGSIRKWWEGSELRAYRHARDEGHLRTLTLREAKRGKGKMAMLTVSGNPKYALKRRDIEGFVEAVREVFDDASLSVFLQIHQIAEGRPTQFFEMPLYGPDHITEKLEVEVKGKRSELACKISPTSFFQPNTVMAGKIYSLGLNLLEHLDGARVLDLYCGGATIGLSCAHVAKEVIGIELNHHCVFDAKWNAEVNEIENFSIHRGDVGTVLSGEGDWKADVVIVDPPRCGLDDRAIREVVSLLPKEILYISCNPKTQAENCMQLCEKGYLIKEIQPVDQFPHTPHIENIVVMQKP